MVHNDVLIKNNKYGYVTMQNNGAMKIVNFTHVQMAETRRSFLRPWTSGMRLIVYLSVHPTEPGPLFIFWSGINSSPYTGHSFRIRAATCTTAAACGVEDSISGALEEHDVPVL